MSFDRCIYLYTCIYILVYTVIVKSQKISVISENSLVFHCGQLIFTYIHPISTTAYLVFVIGDGFIYSTTLYKWSYIVGSVMSGFFWSPYSF